MNHLLVLAFLITVLVGTGAVFLTWQLHQRYRLSRLQHLLNYLVSFNLVAFGYLVAQYAFTNLLGTDPSRFPRSVFVISVGVFPLQAGLSWTALRLAWALRRRDFPGSLRRAFIAGAAAFGVCYAVGLTLLLNGGDFRWLVGTHMALGLAMTVALVVAFLGLAACRGRELTADQGRSVRRLGWGLLIGHLALSGSVALPEAAHLPVLAAALLWLNCVPLLWLHTGFDRYFAEPGAAAPGESTLAALVRKHGITPREREVMELIAQGRSNKEIEERLCISFSTVKNHAYSLYRKLGVGSRAELIHLVLTRPGGWLPGAPPSADQGQPPVSGTRILKAGPTVP